MMTMIWMLLAALTDAAPPPMPAFLTGCWERIDGKSWTQECWMEPRGGLMLGAAREGTGETIKIWEQMTIERGTDGALTFYASPRGTGRTPFKAEFVSATEIRFTNAANDYPQRIRYALKNGKIEAEISLLDGSKPTRWTYSREGRAN
jgi:hypothetical protein